MNGMIFVFGSNVKGIHGAGAARHANEIYKAKYGVGEGRTGDSYAIPTKGNPGREDRTFGIGSTLPLYMIQEHVDKFIEYAKAHPELEFQVTCIGCGLAGLDHMDIAPMFAKAPDNCSFDTKWMNFLIHPRGRMRKFWGTFD